MGRQRMRRNGLKLANANGVLLKTADELAKMQDRVETHMAAILADMGIDRTDPNVTDTPKRWAKMMVREAMAGRFNPCPSLTTFPNTNKVDEVIGVGPIAIRSMCSHHFVPIIGRCWVGVIPGERLLGLSKYARIAHWVASRPQIQEELAEQIADTIEGALQPKGIAVVIKAAHLCMSWRGVHEGSSEMVSSVTRGIFRVSDSARAEFTSLVVGSK